MAKHLVEVVDDAGVTRMVKAVDAREIEAAKANKSVEAVKVAKVDENVEDLDPAAFPKDFPGAGAFTKEGIGYHQVLRMTKEELVEVKGIGASTADEILKHRTV